MSPVDPGYKLSLRKNTDEMSLKSERKHNRWRWRREGESERERDGLTSYYREGAEPL